MRGPAVPTEDSGHCVPEILYFVPPFAILLVLVDFGGGEGDGAFFCGDF